MNSQRKHIWISFTLFILLGGLIWNLGYNTPREEFNLFIGQFFLAFVIFYYIWLNKAELKFSRFLILAIVLRLILLPSFPLLSDDFFRFAWDGELLTRGINPYAHTPNDLISHSGIMMDDYLRKLYHGMSTLSQENYTCYPVVNQFFFSIPAFITESTTGFLLILKSILILADIGIIWIGKKILEKLERPVHYIWLYALNPFIILEFSGNCHFEGVMLFFLLLAIWLIMTNKWLLSSVFWGIAVQIKLIPLLLIPFVLKHLKWRKSLGYVAMTSIIILLTGKLLLNDSMLTNLMDSINNYYTNFEFNAGIFYIVREIGLMIKGWDIIEIAGPLMRNLAFIGIIALAVLRKYKSEIDIFKGMAFALIIYYSMASIVHPWYVSSILLLTVFTQYKFGLIWSLLAMLSYFSYSNSGFTENVYFLWTEYLCLYGILGYEIYKYTKRDNFGVQIKEFFGRAEN